MTGELPAAGLLSRVLLGGASTGAEAREMLRYGFTLDTQRAGRELGFQPRHRIGLARAGDGALSLETPPL